MSAKERNGRIAIIADDEELGRVLLGQAVAGVGLKALAFTNGAEALAAALVNDVAIVLLDVDMPVMDGNEVCRRLRADPRFSSVPIVIVTGHQDSAAIRRAFDAGATDFVSKPVNWALLPHRLEYILRNAAAAEHTADAVVADVFRDRGLDPRRRQGAGGGFGVSCVVARHGSSSARETEDDHIPVEDAPTDRLAWTPRSPCRARRPATAHPRRRCPLPGTTSTRAAAA